MYIYSLYEENIKTQHPYKDVTLKSMLTYRIVYEIADDLHYIISNK